MRSVITLTTDFGPSSPYVAQMKGVMLSIFREVDIVDISHAIGPQNVQEGAIVLADATPRFPEGTIHVAVVDPGVGTSRRILYAEIGQQRYVAPDNGILSRLTHDRPPSLLIVLENRKYWLPNPSLTFHGRDIMAPVAAHLAIGVAPDDLGPRCALEHIVGLVWRQPLRSADEIVGEVLYIDTFGNLITNIERKDVQSLGNLSSLTVECGGQAIRGIVPTYDAAMPGELIALFDSQERLEIATVRGQAACALKVSTKAAVVVKQE
jgi:S-adenosyl-L-methionine hydrolase (adenosine-forming)